MNSTTIEIKPSFITGYNEIRCVYGLFFSEEIVSIDMVNIGVISPSNQNRKEQSVITIIEDRKRSD